MDLYNTLGVSKDATSQEIKAAYRSLAHKHHPDRPDGNTELFQSIQRAYEVLSDEHKRAHYDRTGDIDGIDYRTTAISNLAQLFSEIIDSEPSGDVVEACKNHVNSKIEEITRVLARQRKILEKLEKIRLRVINKSGQESIFTMVADQKVIAVKGNIAALDLQSEVMKEMIVLLNEHEDVSPKPNIVRPQDADFENILRRMAHTQFGNFGGFNPTGS